MLKSKTHKQRLLGVVGFLLCVSVAVYCILYSLQQNINLFFSATELIQQENIVGKKVKLGGLVVNGSVKRNGLRVSFMLTDKVNQITVYYQGLLPDLFKEGQGIVTSGRLQSDGSFTAVEVLAKHDENYYPSGAKYAITK